MKINHLVLNNYRCFERLKIDFHDEMTVLVGNNGAGKTSVLEALAVSLGTFFDGLDGIPDISISKKDARMVAYAMGEADDIQSQYPVEIISEGEVEGNQIQWKRSLESEKGRTTKREATDMIAIAQSCQKRLRGGDRELILPLLAYYGTGRLWDSHRKKQTDIFRTNTKTNGYIDSLAGTANVKLMMDWFKKKTVQRVQSDANGMNSFLQLPTVYRAMEQCFVRSTGYNEVRIDYNLDTNELDCHYVDELGNQMKMPLSQLSDGYKGTVSLIADIAYRMAVLNPQLGTAAIEETDGIVLIDEVDLHLHPAWQHHVLADLHAIFPKIQFIVTTHAPAVISSVKSENLVVFGDYDVEEINTEVYGNDVNSILNEVMGADNRNPVIAEKFAEFNAYIGKGAFDKAESILNEIDKDRGYHDKEVVADRVKLKVERVRGGVE